MENRQQYNPTVQNNEPTHFIYYFSQKCRDCSIFNNELNKFLSTNKDKDGNCTYQLQAICVDNIINQNQLPRQLRMVPAIVYNQRIYQGREAFQWFNKFTSTKSFTPLGTEKKDIAFTFLDGSENTTDSFSTTLGQGPPQGSQGPPQGSQGPPQGSQRQNFNEDTYYKNLTQNNVQVQQYQPGQPQPEMPDALKPQKIDKKSDSDRINAVYEQLTKTRVAQEPKAPRTQFDPSPQQQPEFAPAGQMVG